MQKRNTIQIMADLMEGMNTMIDASGQMVHQFGNIKFMAIRDMLNLIKDGFSKNMQKTRID